MRSITISARTLTIALLAVAGPAVSASEAALLYNSDFTQVKSTVTISGTSSAYSAIGDDFNTGASSITITGMSFYGGVDPSLTQTQVTVSFFDTAGHQLATIYPSKAETVGTNSVHTIQASDFNLNGNIGLTLPGAGYVVFGAVSYGTFDINTGIFTPGDDNPAVQLGGGIAPTVGTNNGAAAAQVDNNGVLTTPTAFSANGIPANQSQYTLFSLTGTAVPEPALVAFLLPAVGLIRRRV